MKRTGTLLLALFLGVFFASYGGATIIPDDRTAPWQGNVGVPGGIPTRTTIWKNIVTDLGADPTGVVDAAPIISNAINSCPAGQVVYMPAGTFRINSQITFDQNRSNGTLRGAGMGQTVLKSYANGGNGVFYAGNGDWPRPSATIAITSGATKGSTIVTVPNTSSIPVGNIVRLEQSDPTFVKEANGGTNSMSFTFRVVSKTSTTVTLSAPIPYTLTNSPRLAVYTLPPLTGFGFEDFTFDLNNSGAVSGIFLIQAYGCWIKGVEVKNSNSRQFFLDWVVNCEIRRCYTHDIRSSGPNHEGIDFFQDSSWNLIEDNICVNGGFPHIILGDSEGGCAGNVIAYNYSQNVDTGSTVAGAAYSSDHGPHNMMNLFEGNIGQEFTSDGYFGSSSHTTVFRNALSGVFTGVSDQWPIAVALGRWSNYYNIVGNVLGQSGYTDAYETEVNGYPDTLALIYRLGYPNMGNPSYDGTWPATNPPNYTTQTNTQNLDLNVKATILRHGNFDYATNGIVWDPAISDHTIPDSLYLAARPGWWPNAMPWPPIGPDRTPMVGQIPAQCRFLGGNCSPSPTSTPTPTATPTRTPAPNLHLYQLPRLHRLRHQGQGQASSDKGEKQR